MQLLFRSIHEEFVGPKWVAEYYRNWPAYRSWFLRDGIAQRPSYLDCRRAIAQHAPRLEDHWHSLVRLADGDDATARLLSLYGPPPLFSGCSQAVWNRDRPLLIRNYDYHPGACQGMVLLSAWHGTKVIASIDCLWGVLDGFNEHGLCVALAFGGSRRVGQGFGIQLHLRYVLEFCQTTEQATQIIASIPSSMAYNVSVVDAGGNHAVVLVGPGRRSRIVSTAVATNHQESVSWPQHDALTGSSTRHRFLRQLLADPSETTATFRARFLAPPLYNTAYERGFGTLYSAVYDAQAGSAEYFWRDGSWRLTFDDFKEQEFLARYPVAT
jgi:predicted choloylglycine hydrolase